MRSNAVGAAYYERTGGGYAHRRKPDPRIERALLKALGDARSVLNIGAGAGSYEPRDVALVALDPSSVMLSQRVSPAPRVQAVSEALPFRDQSFDAALAVLTLHHWSDWRVGIAEMRRVARRFVILTADPEQEVSFWLFEYFPGIVAHDQRVMPPIDELRGALGGIAMPMLIPHDCVDGFLGAYWRRPEMYLDADVRSAMSGFAALTTEERERGLNRLCADLESGQWGRRFGAVLGLDAADLGYRLVVGGR